MQKILLLLLLFKINIYIYIKHLRFSFYDFTRQKCSICKVKKSGTKGTLGTRTNTK